MRNLKKILALVLALIMSLSLMTTAGAAETTSATGTETYAIAKQVLEKLEVFKGDLESGDMRYGESVKRSEAAALLYRIATGDVKDTQAKLYSNQNFTDGVTGHWAEGYIAYCYNAEIIKGVNAEHSLFDPDGDVTGYQVLAMALRTLGYGKNHEFEGNEWIIQTAARARQEGLLDGVTAADEATLGQSAPRGLIAQILFNALLQETVEYDVRYPNAYPKSGTTLGEKTLDLKEIEGVVMANEYADLESDTVLAEGKTRLDVDGKVYNLDVTSQLTDIGELRHAYVHKDTEVLTSLTDEGGNNVKDSKDLDRPGQGITVEKLRGNLRLTDETQYFTNFGYESGNHNSEWRLEWNVTFTAGTTGEALFTREYANVRQLCANETFPASRVTYTVVRAGVTTTTQNPLATDTVFGFTRVIWAGERITDADLAVMRGIFSSADSVQGGSSLGINGYVFAGTNSSGNVNRNKDLSDDMTWRTFYDQYIRAGEQEITGSVNGEWLKIIDNNDDGIAEYVFLTHFWMTTVTGHNTNNSQDIWELEDGRSIDANAATLKTYDGDLEVLPVPEPILYTYIDGVWHVNKPTPVKMTVAAGGITNKVGVKDDVLKGTDGTEYDWSEISHKADYYYDEVDYATVGIAYNLYQDHFGFTRLFTEATGGFVLLTDAFYDTDNRSVVIYKAEIWNGGYVDVTVNNPTNARATVFIDNRVDGGQFLTDREKNTWGRLRGFDDVYYAPGRVDRTDVTPHYMTNVAAFIVDEDGNYTLGRVQERNDKLIYEAYAIDTDNYTVTAKSQTLYGLNAKPSGTPHTTLTDRRIQATTQTEYYWVRDPGTANENIVSWVGYANAPSDLKGKIVRAYAVASTENRPITADGVAENLNYSIADVVVFEAVTESSAASILAIALGNKQFGQREQAVTGLTKNGQETIDLLTRNNMEITKSRTPNTWPDEVDEMLEVYTYDETTGQVDNVLGPKNGYEANKIYAGNVIDVVNIRGIDYIVLTKHSAFNPGTTNAASPVITLNNEYDRDPSNLVYIPRNTVADYTVVYSPAADLAEDASKAYRLDDNNAEFARGDMVIYMTNSSGAAYVINVSNSTWFNPATSAVEVVPRLHWTHTNTASDTTMNWVGSLYERGLYQRIYFEYEDNHGNKADAPTVKITPNGADKTAVDIDDAIKGLTKGVNGEYLIPYAMHKGQDVAFTVTPNTAIDKGATASPSKGTLKFPGNDKEVGLPVTVTGSKMVGDGKDAESETYYYVFRFVAPRPFTVDLTTVANIINAVGTAGDPDSLTIESGYHSTIPDFIKAIDNATELAALRAAGETIKWLFFDSNGNKIVEDSATWKNSVQDMSQLGIVALVIAEDGTTKQYYQNYTPGTGKVIVVAETTDGIELLDRESVDIVEKEDGTYVVTAITTDPDVKPVTEVGGAVYEMKLIRTVTLAIGYEWKVELVDADLNGDTVIYVRAARAGEKDTVDPPPSNSDYPVIFTADGEGYTVEVKDEDGNAVASGVELFSAGEQLIITVKAKEGYVLETVTIGGTAVDLDSAYETTLIRPYTTESANTTIVVTAGLPSATVAVSKADIGTYGTTDALDNMLTFTGPTAANNNTVTLTSDGMKLHKNAADKWGSWVGFEVALGSKATNEPDWTKLHYTWKSQSEKTINLTADEGKLNEAGKKGIAFYYDVKGENWTSDKVTVQLEDANGLKSKVLTYTVNLSGAKPMDHTLQTWKTYTESWWGTHGVTLSVANGEITVVINEAALNTAAGGDDSALFAHSGGDTDIVHKENSSDYYLCIPLCVNLIDGATNAKWSGEGGNFDNVFDGVAVQWTKIAKWDDSANKWVTVGAGNAPLQGAATQGKTWTYSLTFINVSGDITGTGVPAAASWTLNLSRTPSAEGTSE